MSNIFLINDYITNGFRIEFVDVIYMLSILLGILTIISKNPIVSVLYLIGLFVNINNDTLVNNGHGDGETKWKGWFWKLLFDL